MRAIPLILAVIFCGASVVSGQSAAESVQGFKDSGFEVVAANPLFVTTVEDCNTVILITVHVRRGPLTGAALSGFAQQLRSRLPKDQSFAAFFFTDQASAKQFFATIDSDQDAGVLRAVRGVHTFHGSPLKEKSKIFPSGLTESDLEKFGNNQ